MMRAAAPAVIAAINAEPLRALAGPAARPGRTSVRQRLMGLMRPQPVLRLALIRADWRLTACWACRGEHPTRRSSWPIVGW